MRRTAPALILFACSSSLFAQELSPRAKSAFSQFEARHGSGWIVKQEPHGFVGNVLGKSMAPAQPVRVEEDFLRESLRLLDENEGLFGVSPAVLKYQKVERSHLAALGVPDKFSVTFEQEYAGIPVEGKSTSMVFLPDGRCVSIAANVIPEIERVDLRQALSASKASLFARQEFVARYGFRVDQEYPPELEILEVDGGPRLVWSVRIRTHEFNAEGLPTFRELSFDANTANKVLLRDLNMIHTHGKKGNLGTISGNVEGWANSGLLPYKGPTQNMELIPIRFADLDAYPEPDPTTDNAGYFEINDIDGFLNLTAYLNGFRCDVDWSGGTDSKVEKDLFPGFPQTFTFNQQKSELETAEVNAYRWVMDFRDWYLAIDPGFDPMNFQVNADVNINSNCNAYYDYFSINFFTSGGGCANTCYSTVIIHEEGHYLNDRTGSGNGSDGFGEGTADVWAMYMTDQPILGHDFRGPGNYIRIGTNTRQFCGDNNRGCYGQVHADGEVLMGAMWKARAYLQARHGIVPGGDIANALLVAWYKNYNDYRIHTEILDHWLILDDDDGDLGNGTPHCYDIKQGFLDQGFPDEYSCDELPPPVLNTVYVDVNHTGPEDGTRQFPFNTVLEGINAVEAGGDVIILAGSYPENLSNIRKSLVLKTSNGSVTIGD